MYGKAHPSTAIPHSPQHPQSCFLLCKEMDLLLPWGAGGAGAQCSAKLHTWVLHTVPRCRDLTGGCQGVAVLDGRVGTEVAHGMRSSRVSLAPPAKAWGGCISGSVGLGQGGVGWTGSKATGLRISASAPSQCTSYPARVLQAEAGATAPQQHCGCSGTFIYPKLSRGRGLMGLPGAF